MMKRAGLCLSMIVGVGAAAFLAFGCDPWRARRGLRETAQGATDSGGETPAQAVERARKEECLQLATKPDTLIETSNVMYHDRGTINDYRQLAGVFVTNNARHCSIESAEGDAIWSNSPGAQFGSTPFRVNVSIPPGARQRVTTDAGTLTAGTLQWAGMSTTLHFTHVEVRESP